MNLDRLAKKKEGRNTKSEMSFCVLITDSQTVKPYPVISSFEESGR